MPMTLYTEYVLIIHSLGHASDSREVIIDGMWHHIMVPVGSIFVIAASAVDVDRESLE